MLLGDRLQRPLEGGEVVSVLRVGQDGMGEGNSLQLKKIGNVLYFRKKKNTYLQRALRPQVVVVDVPQVAHVEHAAKVRDIAEKAVKSKIYI